MRILCISAQKPDSTGSGVYLAETVRSLIAAGHEVCVIAGIDRDDDPALPAGCQFVPVRYNTDELPFPVCGMSDVMPYEATRYRDMTPDMVDAFRRAFSARIEQVCRVFRPQAVVCHHLYLVCSVLAETLDRLGVRRTVAAEGASMRTRLDAAGDNRKPVNSDQAECESDLTPCAVWALCHSTDLRQMESHDLERERIISAVSSLDGIMALHSVQKAQIVNIYGVSAEKVVVVGTGYNSREFHDERALRASRPLRILYVGKICRAKGVESLVRSLSLMPASPHEVELHLVGGHSDPDQYERIVEIARRSPIPVTFCGRVSQDDLVRAYSSAHLFALPSFFEGLPLVTIEAMACGCRCVVTDLPGVRSWLAEALPGAPIAFVEPPTIVDVDTPVEEELPAFEQDLADAMASQLSLAAAHPETGTGFDTSSVSWDALARRMASLLAGSACPLPPSARP